MMATQTPSPATTPANGGGGSGLFSNRRLWLAIIGVAIVLLILSIIFSGSSNSWQATNAASGHTLALLIDPQHPTTIYAGNDQGQVLSTSDGGQTWTRQQGGLPGNANAPINALLAAPTAGHLYAGTDGGVYASTDSGQHWQKSSNGLPGEDVVDALALGSADGKTLIAGTARGGAYVSHDAGATWQPAGQGLPDHADIYGLTTTPTYNAIFAALIGAGIYVSHDGGASWQAANTGIPAHVDAFAIAATVETVAGKNVTHLYAGTSQGFYSSTDDGATWKAGNKGLGNARVISIAGDPASALQLAIGTDSGVFGTLDGGATWQAVAQGLPSGQHVGAIAISHPTNQSDIIYAALDSLYRYPGLTSAFWGVVSRVAIFGLLFIFVLWVFLRQGRVMRDFAPASPPPGMTPRTSTAGARPKPRGATSHIRGGPPPRRSPPPTDEQK